MVSKLKNFGIYKKFREFFILESCKNLKIMTVVKMKNFDIVKNLKIMTLVKMKRYKITIVHI